MLKGKTAWTKKIRPDAMKKASNGCEICGVETTRLICHDKWQYDDTKLVAALVAFEIHCGACDLVCHFKRMMQVADPNTVLVAAIDQMCVVNSCKEEDAMEMLLQACNLWEKRNKERRKVAVSSELLKQYPELASLPAKSF